MPNTLDALLKLKPVMALAAIAAVAVACHGCKTHDAIYTETHTQGLLSDMNVIMNDVGKLPPGIPRAEELMRRLKALDPGLAQAEVRQGLRDYLAALEGWIEATKAGRETTQYDLAMDDAKKRLDDYSRKYR
jgi:hypothetical protein